MKKTISTLIIFSIVTIGFAQTNVNDTLSNTKALNNKTAKNLMPENEKGNLMREGAPAPTWECISGTPNWNIGGNNFSGLPSSFPGLVDANIGTCDPVDFILKTSGVNKVWIKAGGNVGIASSNPLTKLDVTTGNTNDGIRINQTGTTAAHLGLFHTNSAEGQWAIMGWGTGNGARAGGFSIFDYNSGAGADRLFIKANTGYVGINNTNPSAQLSVTGQLNGLTANFISDHNGPYAYNTILSVNQNFAKALAVHNTANNPLGEENFVVYGNGKTEISSTVSDPLLIKETGTNYQKLKLIQANNDTKLWVINQSLSYNLGVDNAGIGHIGANLNINGGNGVNLINFRTIANNAPQVWIGDGILPNTPHSNAMFSVEGKVVCQEVIVTQQNWADYVFAPSYKLKSLDSLEEYIKINKHLPNVPSAIEMKTTGENLGEISKIQMEKIEELTLYIIEQNKKVEQQQNIMDELQKQLEHQQDQINALIKNK